jgi:hypothetical protein
VVERPKSGIIIRINIVELNPRWVLFIPNEANIHCGFPSQQTSWRQFWMTHWGSLRNMQWVPPQRYFQIVHTVRDRR